YLLKPTVLDGGDLGRIALWQTGLVAAGVLVLLLGLFRLFRRVPAPPLGAFVFADALHLWEVDHDRVTATPLDRLTDVDCYHTVTAGARIHIGSKVVLSSRTGTRTIFLAGRETAEQLTRFLYALVVLRRDAESAANLSPAVVGAVA